MGASTPAAIGFFCALTSSLYELIGASDGGPLGVFQSPPAMVPVAQEVQGEAVTYSLDGESYFTSSETVGALASQLSRVGCLYHGARDNGCERAGRVYPSPSMAFSAEVVNRAETDSARS